MGFNFNHFFGYENIINKNPDLVLIYGFAFIIFGMLALTFIGFIFGKLGFKIINEHFIGPLTLSLFLCLLVAIVPTVVLKIVANDVSGVKLLYCWLTIFCGITFFCFSNYAMLGKWGRSFRD
ncbi:hypothetical protein LPB86_05660 [Pedobacter sp. MC2016-14]|uniref:hypothetical protein n=1 Tax=Pedobacter sp. MC2016-14 TaxID=2897327 RepID=UPI001E48A584|nr:hypothetical protein [Pedobacter sp. MC2016-14]MCD0487704.1 hypothetical protein [Pedobacter sp. MC2016-14]